MIIIFLASAVLIAGFTEQLRNLRISQLSKDIALRSEKVVVEIYYESLCPDSLELLTGSFLKAWRAKELREHMDVRLYPFGNADMHSEEDVDKEFKVKHPDANYPLIDCQHGEEECLGNMIQACAVKKLQMIKSVNFILCMAAQGAHADIKTSSSDCAGKLGVDMNGITDCVGSEEGHQLMAHLGRKSLDPQLQRTYVPFVLLNGKHEKAADENDFLRPFCHALGAQQPSMCESSASVNGSGQISLAHHKTNSTFCYRKEQEEE